MLKRIGAEEGGEFKAVASGTLPSGKPVVVNADGTVSVVDPAGGTSPSSTPVLGNAVVFREGSTDDITSVYDTNSNKLVVAYIESTGSGTGKAIVGTVSGGSITFGTAVAFETGGNIGGNVKMVFDSSNNKVVICYRDDTNSNYGTAVVGTVSGTSISFGTPVVFESTRTESIAPTFDSTNNKVVVCFRDDTGQDGYGIVGTVSGTSISFGSRSSAFNSGYFAYAASTFDSNAGKVVCAYQDFNAAVCYAVVGTVSGTSISFGSQVQLLNGRADGFDCSFDSSNNKVVVIYRNDGGTSNGELVVGTVSGTSISFGSVVTFHTGTTYQKSLSFDPTINKFVLSYRDGGDSNLMKYVLVTVSGTSATISSETASALSDSRAVSGVYDPDSASHLVSFTNGSTVYGTTQIVTTTSTGTNLTSENYIGMSRGVAFQTTIDQSAGTPVEWNSNVIRYTSAAYDANAQKVVVAYYDFGDSGHGYAAVGTVSGTSISFGTPVEFENAEIRYPAISYDTNAQKVLITYQDVGNSNYGTAIVGTVSGTSISFGTATVFKSAGTLWHTSAYDPDSQKIVIASGQSAASPQAAVATISGTSVSFGSLATYGGTNDTGHNMAYDTNTDRVVIAYRDASDTQGKSVVGTVSGTSISFGSEVVFESGGVEENFGIAYDASAQKIVIAYITSSAGAAKVGTVSGTSISYGSSVEYSSSASDYVAIAYDSNAESVAIFYRDASPFYGKAVSGKVSGTSISFTSELTFQSGRTQEIAAAYDANAQKVVVAYRDYAAGRGDAVVFTTGFTSTTRAEVADGGNASMDIIGSVSDNQIGLTAGQQYYVQTDGTISTTADDPSVLAGTAISATELVVKT